MNPGERCVVAPNEPGSAGSAVRTATVASVVATKSAAKAVRAVQCRLVQRGCLMPHRRYEDPDAGTRVESYELGSLAKAA